jgi:hypothetical protein
MSRSFRTFLRFFQKYFEGDLRMIAELRNEYYVSKTYAETAMEVIKSDWENRKARDVLKEAKYILTV